MQKVLLLTTNQKRADKYKAKFEESGLEILFSVLDESTPELQGEEVESVARYSAKWAADKYQIPVIKEDASFEIPSLNGFPGIYVKHMNVWLGAEGYINLMKGKKDRRACWNNVLCYAEPGGIDKTFSSITWGSISSTISKVEVPGSNWSIDKVWIPQGFSVPIAEIDPDIRKKKVWVNDKFTKFKDWYLDYNGK